MQEGLASSMEMLATKTFRKALQHFGPQGITELTATIGYYAMLAGVLNAFEVEPDVGVTLLLPD